MNSDKSKKLKLDTETRRAGWTSKLSTNTAVDYIKALEAEVEYLRLCHASRPKGGHDKKCTTCDHAGFRTSTNGRRMLDQPGKCAINVRLPHAYTDVMRKIPEPNYITKHTAAGCPFHSKVK